MRQAETKGDPFEIAILDFLMPGTDGETLGRAIKSDTYLRKTSLMLLTSGARVGDGSELYEDGFDAYLMKPVRPVDLLDALGVMRATAASPNLSRKMITRHSLNEIRLLKQRQKDTLTAVLSAQVLVAEDNTVNRVLATRLLEKFGCRVDLARNGVDAVEMWSQQRYDLILMDCHMPQMDGYEATAEIRLREARRAGAAGRRTPILALTASAREEDLNRCLAAGMDDFISKPVEIKNLRSAVSRWFNQPLIIR